MFRLSPARLCLAALLGWLGLSAPVAAATLTWLIEGTASGELDGAAFEDAAFRFTLRGRTENRRADLLTETIDPLDRVRIAIAGREEAELLIPTRLGVAKSLVGAPPVVFLSRSDSLLDLFDFSIAAPVGLRGPFAAILGGEVFGLDQFRGVATSRGALSIARAGRVRISAVPLPAAGWLLLAGAGALAALGRQPKTRAKIASTCLV